MLRMLGQNEYGLYSLVASVVAYLTVLDLGFANAIVRYTAKFRAEGKINEQYEMFGMFILLYCAIGILAFLAGLGLYFNVDSLFGDTMTAEDLGKIRIMMLLMIFNIAFTFPMSIWGAIMTAYERFIFPKVINIIRIILNPVVMVILLYMGYKAIAMVVVLTLFNIITLCINAWYCKYRLQIKVQFGKFNFPFLKEVAAYSFWIFLNSIIDRIYWNVGQLIIGVYIGALAVAIYSVAIQIQSFYSSFSFAISNVLLPKTVKMTTLDNDSQNISNFFIRIGRIQFYIMSLIFCGFLLFGKRFVILWAGPNYIESYIISILFLFPILFSSIQTLGYSILQARNQLKFRSTLLTICSLVALILSIPATEKWGNIGCAACMGGAILIGHVILLNIYYHIKAGLNMIEFWRNILRLSLIPIIITPSYYFIMHYLLPNETIAEYIMHIIIFSVIFISLSIKFNFNEYERQTILCPIKQIIKLWGKKS